MVLWILFIVKKQKVLTNLENMNCKHCGSEDIVKNGRDIQKVNGVPKYFYSRFRCKSCGRSFTLNTGSKHTELPPEQPEIAGVMLDDDINFETDILPNLIKLGERSQKKVEQKKLASITMPSRPFAIAIMSDVHGGSSSDYKKIKRDIEIITSTQDMYCILAGDITDNYIFGKLQQVQRLQPTTMDDEYRFLKWFIEKLKDNIIAFVSGNHDNWMKKLTAFDHLKEMLSGVNCIFDNQQAEFNLFWGANSEHYQKWVVRHKWKNGSVFNPTHGQEVAWERMGVDFDVAIGGHTHIASICRPFVKHDKIRYAVLLGTYKIIDEFAREVGFAPTYSSTSGSGALVYHPDGRDPHWCSDLETARDLLYLWKMKS